MAFRRLDLETWPRRPWFEHYLHAVPCTYSMTVELDVTGVVQARRRLYPAMLHAVATVVNRHEEFRTALDDQGRVGVYDRLHPCYTVFHPQSETFSNLWTPFCPEYVEFLEAYQEDLHRYGAVEGLEGKPDTPENTFPISMIPWESFTGFHLHLDRGSGYLLPIFTMGRCTERQGRTWMPMAIQVHHAVCDGYHLCRFVRELRELLAEEQ